MSRLSTVELFKENMKFSIGHFTIFSKESRENLHGHNYNLHTAFTTEIESDGLSFDYRFYKDKLYKLCKSVDETVLLPGLSPYLTIEEKENYYHAHFNSEVLMFLKRDVKILPITNVTVEELSNWFLNQILLDQNELHSNRIVAINVKVFSGPGQLGSSSWKKNNTVLNIPEFSQI